MVPTVDRALGESTARPDPRLPDRRRASNAVRLTYLRAAGSSYWGIQETNWKDAPALEDPNSSHEIGGRELRPLLQRLAPPHGRAGRRWGDVLGREHAARHALERDDDRDRQGSPAAAAAVGLAPVSRIAVFGAGYVGLVTGACFAELGHDVVVRDVVPEKVDALRARRGADLRAGPRRAARAQRRAASLHARRREALDGAEFVFVCVDTPPLYSGDADLSARLDGRRRAAGATRARRS